VALVSDEAICLRLHDFSETSQIVTLFTRRHGLIRTLAKGAKRLTKAGRGKFDGGIDLLDLGDAVFIDKLENELHLLTEWRQADPHLALRRSARPTRLALLCGELTTSLFAPHDAHPQVFERLATTLIDLPTPLREETALAFVIDAVDEAGLTPVFDRCVACSTRIESHRPAVLAIDLGGLVCESCEGRSRQLMRLDARLLSIASMIARLPRVAGRVARLPRLAPSQTDPLLRLFSAHVGYASGREIRSARTFIDRPSDASRSARSPARWASAV
jgi:DNA repair protein RecO (recombination protein O)